MSINYYFRKDASQDIDDALHIGLSSGGYFTFQAHPAKVLITRGSWMAFLTGSKGEIVSELGHVISLNDFKRISALAPEDASRPQFANSPVVLPGKPLQQGLRYRDGEGYLFANYAFS